MFEIKSMTAAKGFTKEQQKYITDEIMMKNGNIDLFQFSYKTLKDKFIENFEVNHLCLDLLEKLNEINYDESINFIVENFEDEFTNEELNEIFEGIKE